MLRLDLAAKTDIGLVRKTNQDVARVAPELRLALVADGLGGCKHGDVASQTATEGFERAFARLGGPSDDVREVRQRLLTAFLESNQRLAAHPLSGGREGMATTLVAATFPAGHVVTAHVGDSRCYRLRGTDLDVLTEDHSYAAELRRRGLANTPEARKTVDRWLNVLTRSVNGAEDLAVDIRIDRCEPGDILLLCSDGLWGGVRAEALANILRTAADASAACDKLIGAAWAAGGLDNIAVAVVRVEPNVARLDPPPAGEGRPATREAGLEAVRGQLVADGNGRRVYSMG